MKVKVTATYSTKTTEGELRDYVSDTLSSVDFDTRGEAESAREIAGSCAAALGRLIEKLFEKGLLEAPDVVDLIDEYDIEEITKL